MLISTDRLSEKLDDLYWITFDCRHDLFDREQGWQRYREGHLPGAIFAPVESALTGPKNDRTGRHPLPDVTVFAKYLFSCGVTASTAVVAYDDVGGQYAARLWWMARWIGLTNVAVLDGGWPKWIAEGRPVATADPTPRTAAHNEVKPGSMSQQNSDDVIMSTTTKTSLVIDARAPERYRGEVEPIDKVAGHIPSAVNRCFEDNLNPDMTMRSPKELRQEFESLLGTWRPEQVIHQCGSGVTACVNLLAMEYAGLNGSALYAGSWSEWISDPARPIAHGP